MNIKHGINYKDVYMIPQESIVESRKECETSVSLGQWRFDMPVYASNMKSVIDDNTCIYFATNGWFYTQHRFGVDLLKFCRLMDSLGQIMSISVGVNQDSYDQLKILIDNDICPHYITVDVANAFSIKAESMVEYLRLFFKNAFVIVGNVATAKAAETIEKWGADAVKVGISLGSACITKNKTGFGVPMMTAISDCANSRIKIPVIADGGVSEHGHIALAIAAGATMVMCGGLFAGYDQSAGMIEEFDGAKYKSYYGSASEHNKGHSTNVEGKKILIPYRGNMDNLLIELKEDLQSSISYAGGRDLSALFNTPLVYSGK